MKSVHAQRVYYRATLGMNIANIVVVMVVSALMVFARFPVLIRLFRTSTPSTP